MVAKGMAGTRTPADVAQDIVRNLVKEGFAGLQGPVKELPPAVLVFWRKRAKELRGICA